MPGKPTSTSQADAPKTQSGPSDEARGVHSAEMGVRAYQRPWLVVAFVAAVMVLVAIDLGVKYWSFAHVAGVPVVFDPAQPGEPFIPPHDGRVVLPGVLQLYLTTNPGAVFGIAAGATALFVTVGVLATGVVSWLFLRSSSRAWWFHAGLALVLGGALGNLYDRLFYGVVRDMFFLFPGVHLPWGWSWPNGSTLVYPWIFNMADVALVVGVILLGVLSFRADRPAQTDAAARS